MPLYDCYCPVNERTVEVRHRIYEEIRTWGELVASAGIAPDDTPPDSEVRRLITGGSVVTGAAGEVRPQAPCGPQCACHDGSA